MAEGVRLLSLHLAAYRLRAVGVPAARAAVQGARQVSMSVVASTLTSVCVFLPVVFASGTVRSLLQPMSMCIGYCLMASLIVAITVVPAAASTVLKKAEPKRLVWFEKIQDKYAHSLEWCLQHRALPLLAAVVLLAFCGWKVFSMGVVLLPEISSNEATIALSTDDDLTKETIASVAGAPLKIHEDSLRRLESYFKGRPAMGENQRKQAMLPEGATVFPNDIGTAPGCGVRTASGKVIVMLPGPPSELVPMLQHYVVPFLKEGSHAVIHSCMIRTFGLGEGAGALKIADLTDAANPTAATYAKENEMFVRVTARAESEEAAEALCRPVVEEICRRYGDVVYGVDVDNLESVVVRLLSEKGLHLATAESCTGGLVAKLITDVSGASEVFGMGLVTYANEAKMKLLGVPAAMLEEHGAVSEPVARAMAEGVREVSGSELGIGITGVAGPTGGTPEKPVGLIYIALSDGTRTWVRRMTPPGRVHGRGWLRDRAAGTALDMVRRYLSDLPLEPVQSAGPATTL